MRLRLDAGVLRGWIVGLVLAAGLARVAAAQVDYPFRDPKLGDDQRIDDLLGRLTLEEKLTLLSDHPKFPRLGIAFSGQVEGLHGLALGGPGGWGGWGSSLFRRRPFRRKRDWARPGMLTCSRGLPRLRATRRAMTTRIPKSTAVVW